MALAGLFPKGWFDSKSSTTKPTLADHSPAPSPSPPSPREASSSSTSTLSSSPAPGRDAQGNFKLPPVALYVSGVAFAVTVGLTVLVVPFVREAASANAKTVVPTLVSHQFAARAMRPGRLRISQLEQHPQSPSPSTFSSPSSLASAQASSKPRITPTSLETLEPPTVEPKTIWEEEDVPDTAASNALLSARQFNTREERKLYGASEADNPEDKGGAGTASPLLGFYALGIATAVVGVSAGIGVYLTAKVMGVSSIDEFADKIRSEMIESMPELAKIIEKDRKEEDQLVGDTTDHSTEQAWSAFIDAYFPDEPEGTLKKT